MHVFLGQETSLFVDSFVHEGGDYVALEAGSMVIISFL